MLSPRLILLADIGISAPVLHFDFERGDQRHLGVNYYVPRCSASNLRKSDLKLPLCLPLSMLKNIAQFNLEVDLLGPFLFSICEDMTKRTMGNQQLAGKT